jgi:phage baseplate assembly protein W
MAYKIQTVNDITSPDIPLGIELTDVQSGTFNSIYSTNKQARVNFKTLLLTRPGERYHQPAFGCNLLNVLFNPITEFTPNEISEYIVDAVSKWLPYINLDALNVETYLDNPTLEHNIKIAIEFSVSDFDTQQITIFANEDGTIIVG